MSDPVEILPVSRTERADLLRFIRIAPTIRRDDPNWVAPLESEMLKVLGPANPFFAHAEGQLWRARRGGRDAGRIAGFIDRTHNTIHGERTASFGFFESENNPAVNHALFDTVTAWARAAGMDRLRGPLDPSINDECGLLIDGFDTPPTLMMTHNPPHYAALVEAAGFIKAKDLLAFDIEIARSPQARLERLGAGLRRRHPQLHLHAVTPRSLAAHVPAIKQIYNDAWQHNWSAVPLTDAEIDFLVARLKPLLVEGLVWLAQHADAPAGFLLALPDFNEALHPLRGRLLSPGLLRALPYLAGWKRPRRIRLVALGVREEFRGRGLEALMFAETLKTCLRLGFKHCEASWVLEDNEPVQRLIRLFGGVPAKRYRLYERAV